MFKTKCYVLALCIALTGAVSFGPAAVTASAQQAQKEITGQVVDAAGQPVIGASIVQKGTNNGVVTDLDGNYTISVPAGTTLQVSSIGYQAYEFVAGQGSPKVTLQEDVLGLEETIVIGYGTARKKDLTGSVVRADIDAFRESPNVNVVSSLQGAVAGLNVGASTSAGDDVEMSVRGRTSISGAQSPLIVLDGVIYRGSMSDINPSDIESIDVLKDASATAIYGSQAAAGVLMITSKNVKSLSKPIISYEGSYSWQAATNELRPYTRDGYLQLFADSNIAASRTGDDLTQMDPSFEPSKYFTMNNSAESYGYDNGIDTDWYGITKNSNPHIMSHNVSLRGRSELNSYFISLGYTDQENYTLNDGLKRYNARANFDAHVTDWMKVGMQAFFTVSDRSGQVPSRTMIVKASPLISPYLVEEGNPDTYRTYLYNTNTNPFLTVNEPDLNVRNNLSATFYVDINVPFIKGLNYRFNASQNYISTKNFGFSNYASPGNDIYSNTVNGYSVTSKFSGGADATGVKAYENEWVRSFDNILTYKNNFGKNYIDATFVYGCEKITDESTLTVGQGFANPVLGYNLLSASDASRRTIGSNAWQETSLYSMARLSYNYDNRYYVTGTVRRDGFSGFGANNKIGVFPSASLAWNITNEDFMESTRNWLDNLKLRVSYGVNGNRSLSRYQTLAQLASTDQYLYGDGKSAEKGSYISALANSDLKWETTATLNAGVDFSFFNSRLFGAIDVYQATTTNLLYNVSIPTINYGLTSMASNIGELNNKGVEVTLTGVPVKTGDFSWTVTGVFSLNRNKVVSILGIDADGDGVEDDLISAKVGESVFIGEPYGVNYDLSYNGLYSVADYKADSKHMYGTYAFNDLNNDGKITIADDRSILSYQDPSYRFSIQNNFRFKNWEFKFFINSIQGGKKWYRAQSANNGIVTATSINYNLWQAYDYWTPENTDATYRQLGNKGLDPDNFVPYINRSFIRLQDVTLSYTVPQSVLQKVKISNLKLFVTGKNLLTFTQWDGLDPESGQGFTEHNYPVMKSVTAGVNFEF